MRWKAVLPVLAVLLVSAPAWADHDGWVSYEDEGGCFGGAKCGRNGWQLRIHLKDAPVTGVRFHAHDDVGDRSRGHLRLRIDGDVIEPDIDVAKNGDWYEVSVDRVRGSYLIFEAFAHDEVVIENIEIRYGRGRGRDRDDHGHHHGDHGDHGGD